MTCNQNAVDAEKEAAEVLELFKMALEHPDFHHVSVRNHFGYRYIVYHKKTGFPGFTLAPDAPWVLDTDESSAIVRSVTGTANGRHVHHH